MNSDRELQYKDSVKLNILREVMAGQVKLTFASDGASPEDYASEIHSDERSLKIYGSGGNVFNLSENTDEGVLTIRPVVVRDSLKIAVSGAVPECKKLTVTRKKATESEFDISKGLLSLTFIPKNDLGYTLALEFCEPTTEASALSQLEEESAVSAPEDAECHSAPPTQAQMEAAREEIDELYARAEADSEIAAVYSGAEGSPELETLLSEIRAKLDEAEGLIKAFIEAGEKKTLEIENEIKAGRRQQPS